MIESYDFGRIVVDGRVYTSDVIIFPNRIRSDWWRREGHRLYIDDLEDVVRERPEVLVVGTGYSGLMEVPKETAEYIRSKGIELVAENTQKAVEVFNELSKSKRVIAALHLTC
ncbi:MAG: MTH938/NDUFAF3 family protein [Candidatus Hodarchaeaceae archaeon]|nr:MTH938/NDUFAF3 family protein [Candidatus Hodarchaeaceae archaeon]